MSRGKNSDASVILGVFPDRYADFDENLKLEGKYVTLNNNWEMNVYSEEDVQYELLAWIEKEDRTAINNLLSSHNKPEWIQYFLTSPFLNIFGLENIIDIIPNLSEVLENTEACAVLADKKGIDVCHDENILMFFYKIFDIMDKLKRNEHISEDEEPTSQEMKAFSLAVLGFNVWRDEYVPFSLETNVRIREDKKENVKQILGRISYISNNFKKQEQEEKLKDNSRVGHFERTKGKVIMCPRYLREIIQAANLSCSKYPWAYYDEGENVYSSIIYNYSSEMMMSEEKYISLKKLLKIIDCENVFDQSLNSQEFIKRYYRFVGAVLKQVKDDDDKYIIFFTIEKIFALDLFEEETKVIVENINKSNALSQEEIIRLGDVLSKIYQLNGAWGKKSVAVNIINNFFESRNSSDNCRSDEEYEDWLDYLYGENAIEEYLQSKKQALKKGEHYGKIKISNYIIDHKSVCTWYLDRHIDILIKKKNLNQWCDRWIPQDNQNILKWVIESSVYNALKYRLIINKNPKDSWNTSNNVDLFEETEEKDNDEDNIWL